MGRRLIYRVDGGSNLGIGHLKRAMVLELELKGEVDFVYYLKDDQDGFEYLKGHYCNVIRIPGDLDRAEEAEYIRDEAQKGIKLVILDILDTDFMYMERIKQSGAKILTFENKGDGACMADVIVNSIIEGPLSRSYRIGNTLYLKGSDYKVLNQHFNHKYDSKNKNEVKLVVTFGGGDSLSSILKVLRAVKVLEHRINVFVIAGPVNRGFEKLKEEIKALSIQVDFRREVENMAELLADADIAITGGGGTLYEIAYMGVPGVVICQNDHQVRNAEFFEKQGAIISLGYAPHVTESMIRDVLETLLLDKGKRSKMASMGKALIDGKGITRVAGIIRGLLS